MTRSYELIGFAFLLLIGITSCSEDEKLPLPIVDFNTDPEIVEVDVQIMFDNLTVNASNYEWDFGDGQTSVQISPTITYESTGTYTVTLKAFTADNQSDSISKVIEVGERVLTALNINDISFFNQNQEDWDEITNDSDSTKYPDFILFFSPQDDPSAGLATPFLVDLAPFELPIGFEINPGGDDLVLTSESWDLTFIDFDGEDVNNPSNEDFEIMEIITFNPVMIPTGTIDEDGDGFIQISLGKYSVDLFFTIQ